MPEDAMNRLQTIADGLQKNQLDQLKALAPVVSGGAPSGAADQDAQGVRDLGQPRLSATAREQADDQLLAAPARATAAGTGPASLAAGVSVVPNVSVDLSAPNTLDASSRSWMAKVMVGLAAVALGVAVAGLVIGDGDTDPGSMPVLCVVVAMIASIGAVLITLGYGSVKLGAGTNSPSATGTSPAPGSGSTSP